MDLLFDLLFFPVLWGVLDLLLDLLLLDLLLVSVLWGFLDLPLDLDFFVLWGVLDLLLNLLLIPLLCSFPLTGDFFGLSLHCFTADLFVISDMLLNHGFLCPESSFAGDSPFIDDLLDSGFGESTLQRLPRSAIPCLPSDFSFPGDFPFIDLLDLLAFLGDFLVSTLHCFTARPFPFIDDSDLLGDLLDNDPLGDLLGSTPHCFNAGPFLISDMLLECGFLCPDSSFAGDFPFIDDLLESDLLTLLGNLLVSTLRCFTAGLPFTHGFPAFSNGMPGCPSFIDDFFCMGDFPIDDDPLTVTGDLLPSTLPLTAGPSMFFARCFPPFLSNMSGSSSFPRDFLHNDMGGLPLSDPLLSTGLSFGIVGSSLTHVRLCE